jgi:tungstate transport system permease protein
VSTLLHGLWDGLRLIFTGDEQVRTLTLRTARVAFESTAFAALLGIPLGVLTGLGTFKGRRVLQGILNAGIRLPPVAVGQAIWLLMWPDSLWGGGPLSGLGWIYSTSAVIVAQTVLALPIVAALTASAVQGVAPGLLAQARAFGASPLHRARLALREARVGVLSAIVAALGTAIASVGAIIIVGGPLGTGTLATAALAEWNQGGRDAHSVAYGTVLLGVFLVLAAVLTSAQLRRSPWIPGRTS